MALTASACAPELSGRRWSLVAATSQSGTGSNGLPVECDKAGLIFATAQAGWLASACNGVSLDVLLVTRDGGARWEPLPVPASVFCQVGCEVYSPPQFFGRTGFVVIGEGRTCCVSWPAAIWGRPTQPKPLPPEPAGTRGSRSSARGTACWYRRARRVPSAASSRRRQMAAPPERRSGRAGSSRRTGPSSTSSARGPDSPGCRAAATRRGAARHGRHHRLRAHALALSFHWGMRAGRCA
jgi:hypothetical protein